MSAKKLAYAAGASIILLCAPCVALAQASDSAARATALPQRVTRAPVIDGRDDDEAWRAAASITGFRVFDPV